MSFGKFLILGLSAVGLSTLAMADTSASYTFTSDHCSPTGVGCSGGGTLSLGTISLTQTTAQALAGQVSVAVTLGSGFGFVSTGAGANASFFFNLKGSPEITYSGLNANWSIPDVLPVNQQKANTTGYAGDGLSNEFQYALDCKTACGNGGSSPASSPLDFTVTASGLTVGSFNNLFGGGSSPFAADVISSNGNTGLIDASSCTGNCGPTTITTPEPTSVLLLATGLLGAFVSLRRRFTKA